MRMLEDEVPGAADTIYLCNFRVSVNGEWLCLKELQDVELNLQENFPDPFSPSPVEAHYIIARDPVIIERRNLVHISKLIVKELIETSVKYGRMLDSDHMPLQHFFIVLEHVLRHGLRPKKGLLGPRKELWDLLQCVEKLTNACEAQDITSSVRDLPTVRTQMGRARAWLRLALMQKKLADYLKILIDHKEVISEFFEPDALMMSEEAIIIVGLLVGLNVIDCNLCVKEEDLDCQQGVIDFSLYLRSSHHASPPQDSPDEECDSDNMITVLDQKNYVEELNRHLNVTIANLQSKVDCLMANNALMIEDLDIANKNIMTLTEENLRLKSDKTNSVNVTTEKADEGGGTKDKDSAKEIERLKQELEAERKKNQEAQQEAALQVSLKAEMEVAMKLLEKDTHDKQETIVSLRRQLDDIKQINLDMYKKLQECESSLKHKTELITKLEAKTFAMTDTLQIMDDKAKDVEIRKNAAEQALVKATEISESLKAEREMRRTMEEQLIEDKELIKKLQEELKGLRTVSKNYGSLQLEHKRLSDKCHEQEETLEELGKHLSASKLEVSQLREEVECSNGSNTTSTINWTLDKDVTHCKSCNRDFNIRRRRHHCRNCGEIFCHSCSDNFTPIPPATKPVRVCDECQIQLMTKNFADSTAYLSRT